MTRHVLDIDDLTAAELVEVLDLAGLPASALPPTLEGRGVALVFEKPSARTRNSSEMAVVALGGHPVTIAGTEVGIDTRETAEDVARTLACYHGVLCARVLRHGTLVRMAAALDAAGVPVPVVNLLSDRAHPCQALADLLTLRERFGHLAGLRLAFVGDGNNVAHSLMLGAARTGIHFRIACPEGYAPEAALVAQAEGWAADTGGSVRIVREPAEAVEAADAVYTDVWVSMGQDGETEARTAAFRGYVVDEALMRHAAPHAVFLHDLPAHRGLEVTAGVIDGPASVVFDQAENRLHTAKAILEAVLGGGA